MTDTEYMKQNEISDEKPPFFASWNRLYFLVILNLVFLIVLLYIFTRLFD